jgi:two-component system chemotaxis response regulator CheB
MKPIRVLVVDDSAFVRDFVIDVLSSDKSIEVSGQATNGLEALQKVRELKPDIVTMDIDMPIMDGLEAIERIMMTHAVPILVLTSKSDAKTAYHAISKGALEVMPKPDLDSGHSNELINKVKFLSRATVISHIRGGSNASVKHKNETMPARENRGKMVAIASSTGGPRALGLLLSGLPENFSAPIVVAQHIADDFVSGMADWLDKHVKLKVKPGTLAESLAPGTVYISPSEHHMRIDSQKRVAFKTKEPRDIYSPSCNVLLTSAAEVYGKNAVGVILTGMGDDGLLGMKAIKAAGGTTIAQDEATSVVFGMPKVAIESRCIDRVLPIQKIASELISLVMSR